MPSNASVTIAGLAPVSPEPTAGVPVPLPEDAGAIRAAFGLNARDGAGDLDGAFAALFEDVSGASGDRASEDGDAEWTPARQDSAAPAEWLGAMALLAPPPPLIEPADVATEAPGNSRAGTRDAVDPPPPVSRLAAVDAAADRDFAWNSASPPPVEVDVPDTVDVGPPLARNRAGRTESTPLLAASDRVSEPRQELLDARRITLPGAIEADANVILPRADGVNPARPPDPDATGTTFGEPSVHASGTGAPAGECPVIPRDPAAGLPPAERSRESSAAGAPAWESGANPEVRPDGIPADEEVSFEPGPAAVLTREFPRSPAAGSAAPANQIASSGAESALPAAAAGVTTRFPFAAPREAAGVPQAQPDPFALAPVHAVRAGAAGHMPLAFAAEIQPASPAGEESAGVAPADAGPAKRSPGAPEPVLASGKPTARPEAASSVLTPNAASSPASRRVPEETSGGGAKPRLERPAVEQRPAQERSLSGQEENAGAGKSGREKAELVEASPSAAPSPATRAPVAHPSPAWSASTAAASSKHDSAAGQTARPAPAAPEFAPPAAAKPVAPAQALHLRLNAGANDSGVDLRVAERGGMLRVAVRTADPDLREALRDDLGRLVARVEDQGLRAEVWTPAVGARTASGEGRDPQTGAGFSYQESPSGGRSGGESGQDRREERQGRPAWLDQLEETFNAKAGNSKEESEWLRILRR
ncbi:MAG: hypothetical protein KIT09_01700 [Bryobacteraceae bacterium]|nr:hypothetical protein [Bryobacteraceae bacterium]